MTMTLLMITVTASIFDLRKPVKASWLRDTTNVWPVVMILKNTRTFRRLTGIDDFRYSAWRCIVLEEGYSGRRELIPIFRQNDEGRYFIIITILLRYSTGDMTGGITVMTWWHAHWSRRYSADSLMWEFWCVRWLILFEAEPLMLTFFCLAFGVVILLIRTANWRVSSIDVMTSLLTDGSIVGIRIQAEGPVFCCYSDDPDLMMRDHWLPTDWHCYYVTIRYDKSPILTLRW